MNRVDWPSWGLLAALGVTWGGSFTLTGAAVADAPPLTVAAGRLIVGAIALLPLAYWLGDGLPRGRRVWTFALIVALAANAVPFGLLAWATTIVPTGVAGVFMAALPLVVLPLAHVFVPGDRLTWIKALGFVVGFAGVLHLLGLDVLAGLGGAPIAMLAQLACIGAATGYAIGSIATKLAPPTHPISFGAAAIGLAAILATPIAFAFEEPFAREWSTPTLSAIVVLGLFPTALAMVLLQLVLRRQGPSFLSLVNYQVPLWAMLFGATFLAETIPDRALGALALILAGVAISQGALKPILARLRRPTPAE